MNSAAGFRSGEHAAASRLVADDLVAAMEAFGVRAAFGITGGAFGTIFDRMSQSEVVRVFHSQQEGMAAYAAMGRGMAARGRELAVCFSTGGPGILNLLTGVAAAYCESVPLMVLTGNSSSRHQNRGALHDSYPGGVDVLEMLRPITVENARARSAEEVVPLFLRFAEASLLRRKPVHLNVPLDISNLLSPGSSFRSAADESGPVFAPPPLAEPARAALTRFLACKRPLVFAGNGVKLSGQADALERVAERHCLPVVVTTHGRGALSEESPHFYGAFGFASDGAAQRFMEAYDADGVLFLGTGLGELSTNGWTELLARPAFKVHVDLDPAKFNRAYLMQAVLQRDLGEVLSALRALTPRRAKLPPSARESMVVSKTERGAGDGPVHPARLVEDVSFGLPDSGAFFADLGNSFAWAFRGARLRRGQELFVPAGLASMGSAFGAALGAATYWKNRPVACIIGDCATLMCGNELKTAVEYDIPLKVFVLNDRGHGMVDHGSRLVGLTSTQVRFRERVNFRDYATALGVKGLTVASAQEWDRLDVGGLFTEPGPALIDVHIDESVVPPIADRARVVTSAMDPLAETG